MRIVVQRWGGSAAVKLPPKVLAEAGIHIGQTLELQVAAGKLVLSAAQGELDALLAQITPENRHGLVLEGGSGPAEA